MSTFSYILLWLIGFAVVIFFYELGYRRGYRAGGMKVLREWKDYMNMEDDRDE